MAGTGRLEALLNTLSSRESKKLESFGGNIQCLNMAKAGMIPEL